MGQRRMIVGPPWDLQEVEFDGGSPSTRITVSMPTPKVSAERAHNTVRDRLNLLLAGHSPVDAVRIIDGHGAVVAEARRPRM